MLMLLWGALLSPILVFLTCGMHLIRLHTNRRYPPSHDFSVAMIVPCKGTTDPDFENNLLNIIAQDYRGTLHIVLCVESEHDAAIVTLRRLEAEHANVHVCVAGLATHSSQKTLNVVKGMRSIAHTNPDIFLIADADIQPHPTWVAEMVGPFIDPRVGATTGFFRRIPLTPVFRWGDYLAGLLGTFISTGIAHDEVKGLWGGSLAVRKRIMDDYNIYERLATEIVDDIAIMHALRTYHIERRFVKSCILKNYCHMSASETLEWFIRQTQFSQIYLKGLYASYYFFVFPFSVFLLITPALVLYALLTMQLYIFSFLALFILEVVICGLMLRCCLPINSSTVAPTDHHYRLLFWILATPFAIIHSAVALLKTYIRVNQDILPMRWRGIDYMVDVKTGKVLDVIRDGEARSLTPDECMVHGSES